MTDQHEPAGRLYVCGTPIGNLGDASTRLRETLASVGAIACEDTRRTRALLSALQVPAPRLLAFHDHNEDAAAAGVVALLERGTDVALVSDAGMPGISDPGVPLVRAAHAVGAAVLVVPGPSAVAAAVAASGCGGGGYRFVGFLPRSAHDLAQLVVEHAHDVVVAFESPGRLAATLATIAGVQPQRTAAVSRELTKRFERTTRAEVATLARDAAASPVKGEVVLVLEGLPRERGGDVGERSMRLVQALVEEGLSTKTASSLVAQHDRVGRKALYDAVLAAR